VATGSFKRSGFNLQASARTPPAEVFAGVLLAGVVVLVAPLAAYLPNAAMAAILFLVAWSSSTSTPSGTSCAPAGLRRACWR
jgi:SulP family sulfate permease